MEDAQSNRMCCSREGDKAVDAASAKAAKDQELKAESFRRYQQQQQQQQQINSKHKQVDAMAGRFVQS